jgi:Zn finger protein HypA/HybF involved in hydrogenase expression
VAVVALNRTLEQELLALARGASLECLACGEFVLVGRRSVECPECGSRLVTAAAGREEQLDLGVEAG